MSEQELVLRISEYIQSSQLPLSKAKQKQFVFKNAEKLHEIRKATDKTIRYVYDYNKAHTSGLSTTIITAMWIRDVRDSAVKMYEFDRFAKRTIFGIENDFETNTATQSEFRNRVLHLNRIYRDKLTDKIREMSSIEEKRYLFSINADEDFVKSFLNFEKEPERELSWGEKVIQALPYLQYEYEIKTIDSDNDNITLSGPVNFTVRRGDLSVIDRDGNRIRPGELTNEKKYDKGVLMDYTKLSSIVEEKQMEKEKEIHHELNVGR